MFTEITNLAAGIRADRFETIKYQTSNGPRGPGVGKTLGRPWVFKWIFQEMWQRACNNIATADWSVKQSTKSLYNDADTWCDMKHGVRQAYGRCLRYFADHQMLPLHVINPKATGTKYYALTEQFNTSPDQGSNQAVATINQG